MSKNSPGILSMVMLPAVITLVVSILRLVGELQGWDSALFNTEAGGGFSPFGISWLIPIFGFWFGIRHARSGSRPAHLGRAAVLYALVMGVLIGGLVALTQLGVAPDPSAETPTKPSGQVYFLGIFALGAILALLAWPKLTITLMVYGVLARLPVVVLTYLDIHNGWDTHYGELPRGLLAENDDELLFNLCMPQVTAWPFVITPGFGGLLGCLGALVAGKRS